MRGLLVAIVVVAVMAIANAVFGMHTGIGPSFDIVPDPAGLALPF